MLLLKRNDIMMIVWTLGMFLAKSSNSFVCSASNVLFRPILARSRGAKTVASPPASPLVEVRGGGRKSTPAEDTLRHFVEDHKAQASGKFFVQGWRWHTMSVMREAERLQKLALRLDPSRSKDDLERLQKAADYVVGFNLKALHRVEAMFFPKMRQWMSNSKVAEPEMIKAFNNVVGDLEKDKKRLAALGKSITDSLTDSSSTNAAAARTVAVQSGELVHLAKSMLEREISLVMPAVGLCVPEKDQKKFNNQVIKFLGVFDSRCHLVHMHEVVAEANSALEQQLWKESIPSLPRSMIPRWKRTLYEPKASVLALP